MKGSLTVHWFTHVAFDRVSLIAPEAHKKGRVINSGLGKTHY
jgi:(2Fe-2S) ferredoxin